MKGKVNPRSVGRRMAAVIPAWLLLAAAVRAFPGAPPADTALDQKVKSFLESRRGTWYGENVSTADGRILFDLIVEHRYKKALEIGTSTGHSGIWIAWALSRTGGRLVTIEISRSRYEKALANFRDAGLADYVDLRLADAHELIPELADPFDFVFCDAEKEGYKDYLVAVLPKLEAGGCFAAHNVSGRRGMWGTAEFYDYVMGLPDMETSLAPGSPAGMSLSFKRAGK